MLCTEVYITYLHANVQRPPYCSTLQDAENCCSNPPSPTPSPSPSTSSAGKNWVKNSHTVVTDMTEIGRFSASTTHTLCMLLLASRPITAPSVVSGVQTTLGIA
jgi:hypothetical protein